MSKPFGDWMREVAPANEVDGTKKEAHLAFLKDRLNQRSTRRKKIHNRIQGGVIATVVLFSLILGGNLSELGSDGFDIVGTDFHPELEGEWKVVGHRKSKISGLGGDEDKVRDLEEQISADLGQPLSVLMFDIDGRRCWTKKNLYIIDGQETKGGSPVLGRPDECSDRHSEFLWDFGAEWDAAIKAGSIEPVETRFEEVDGHRYLCRVFRKEFLGYGAVTMYQGTYHP